jgi:hypothetical protein
MMIALLGARVNDDALVTNTVARSAVTESRSTAAGARGSSGAAHLPLAMVPRNTAQKSSGSLTLIATVAPAGMPNSSNTAATRHTDLSISAKELARSLRASSR